MNKIWLKRAAGVLVAFLGIGWGVGIIAGEDAAVQAWAIMLGLGVIVAAVYVAVRLFRSPRDEHGP